MTHDHPIPLRDRLDSLAHPAPEDVAAFWFARDLLEPLGYARPENFITAVRRAVAACKAAGEDGAAHFRGVSRTMAAARVRDVRLSRHACHLLAMNGDAHRAPIAFARDYFAPKAPLKEPVETITDRPASGVAASDKPTPASAATHSNLPTNPWMAALAKGRGNPGAGSRFIPGSGGSVQGNRNQNSRWNQNLAVGRGHPNQGARNSR